MASKRNAGVPPRRSESTCKELEPLYPAFCEGSLSLALARVVGGHLEECATCREGVLGLRAFLVYSSATEVVEGERNSASAEASRSTHLGRWTELLRSWLDVVYPGSVPAPAYRGGSVGAYTEREVVARRRSERPFLVGRDERMQIVVHRARGQLLGRVDDLSGLPMFPVLIRLENSRNEGHILNRLDGTFNTDWDPDATGIVCWTPAGGKSFFAFEPR